MNRTNIANDAIRIATNTANDAIQIARTRPPGFIAYTNEDRTRVRNQMIIALLRDPNLTAEQLAQRFALNPRRQMPQHLRASSGSTIDNFVSSTGSTGSTRGGRRTRRRRNKYRIRTRKH